MLIKFRPHKPSDNFLDKLQHLVSEEPGITLCIDSEADDSKRPCCCTKGKKLFMQDHTEAVIIKFVFLENDSTTGFSSLSLGGSTHGSHSTSYLIDPGRLNVSDHRHSSSVGSGAGHGSIEPRLHALILSLVAI